MSASDPIPMVRCRLDGTDEDAPRRLRYVPQAEFGLWKYLMEHRHHRSITVEEISIWVAEDAARWNSGYEPEDLEPVLRLRVQIATQEGALVTVERFFPAESYPQAQEALLSHFENETCREITALPGYFVPRAVRMAEPEPATPLA